MTDPTDDEIERIRARDEATPRDLVTAGYGQVHEDRRTLLAALDASQREAEQLRADLAAETERADTGHRQIAARAEEARAYAERMRDRAAQARRAAIEEAIAECQRVLDASPGEDAGIGVAVKRLRAMLDAPAKEYDEFGEGNQLGVGEDATYFDPGDEERE